MKTTFAKGFYKKAKVLNTTEPTDYIHRPDETIDDVEFSPEKFEPCRIGPDHRERATANVIESSELVKSAKKAQKSAEFFQGFFGKLEDSDKPKRPFWPETWPAPKPIRGTASMFEQDVDIEKDIVTSGYIL